MIRAIIFDLWETLGTKNVHIFTNFVDHFEVSNDLRVLTRYEKAVQLVAWDSEENMARALLLDFGIDTTDNNIAWTRDLFREGVEKAALFPGMLELLQKLKTRYKLGLISNTTIFESAVLDKLDIRNLFDVISFSWETGYLKPSKEAFELTLQKLTVHAEESIFIDDGQKNVDSAIRIGMHGIRYENLNSLKKSVATLVQ